MATGVKPTRVPANISTATNRDLRISHLLRAFYVTNSPVPSPFPGIKGRSPRIFFPSLKPYSACSLKPLYIDIPSCHRRHPARRAGRKGKGTQQTPKASCARQVVRVNEVIDIRAKQRGRRISEAVRPRVRDLSEHGEPMLPTVQTGISFGSELYCTVYMALFHFDTVRYSSINRSIS